MLILKCTNEEYQGPAAIYRLSGRDLACWETLQADPTYTPYRLAPHWTPAPSDDELECIGNAVLEGADEGTTPSGWKWTAIVQPIETLEHASRRAVDPRAAEILAALAEAARQMDSAKRLGGILNQTLSGDACFRNWASAQRYLDKAKALLLG